VCCVCPCLCLCCLGCVLCVLLQGCCCCCCCCCFPCLQRNGHTCSAIHHTYTMVTGVSCPVDAFQARGTRGLVCPPPPGHSPPSSQPALAGKGGGCSPSGPLSLAALHLAGGSLGAAWIGQASHPKAIVPSCSKGYHLKTQDSTRTWQQATSAVQVSGQHTLGQVLCLAPLFATFWLDTDLVLQASHRAHAIAV